ncbi:MAG: FeS assembly protein SufD, partial [Geminicoccaceae bacterium]|nr:FeS assembly protein SufD [Geminicoccaceae bacterium]
MSQTFAQELEARTATATSDGPEWLEPVRRAAMERFAATGFPTSKNEEWRFTPIGPIAQAAWKPAPPTARLKRAALQEFVFGHPEWSTLVFVNGFYREDLSSTTKLEDGLRLSTLSEVLRSDGQLLQAHLGRHATIGSSPFTALNTAVAREGALVHVSASADLTRPIHLVFVTTRDAVASVVQARNLIVVERSARAAVIESYVTIAPGTVYWTNTVSEVVVGPNAWLEHTRI